MTIKNIFFILLAISCCSVACSERKLKVTASISTTRRVEGATIFSPGVRRRTITLTLKNDDKAAWKNVLVELSCNKAFGTGYILASQNLTEVPTSDVVEVGFPLSSEAGEPVKVTILAPGGRAVFERQIIDVDKKTLLYSDWLKSPKPGGGTFGDWIRVF